MPTPKRLTMLCAALVAQLVIGSTTASESAPATAGGCEAEASLAASKLNTTEWLVMTGKHCFAHRLPAGAACPTRYKSQAIAQSECLASAACSGVYRPLGGGGVFFLCDAQHPLQESAEGGTVLRKTPAAAQAQATDCSRWAQTRK